MTAIWESHMCLQMPRNATNMVKSQTRRDLNIGHLQVVLQTCTDKGWKCKSNLVHHLKHKHRPEHDESQKLHEKNMVDVLLSSKFILRVMALFPYFIKAKWAKNT